MPNPVRPRVLLVEDEFLIADMLQADLERLGCSVVGPIRTLEAAVAAAHSTDADAAVINLLLNDKLAFPVADILEQRRIPFGFASGTAYRDLDVRWRVRPFLAKPYTRDGVRGFLLLVLPDHRAAAEG